MLNFPVTFAESHRRIATFSAYRDFFDFARYKYSCLLTYWGVIIIIIIIIISYIYIAQDLEETCKLKFLLKGLECYKDTKMKACNITQVTC